MAWLDRIMEEGSHAARLRSDLVYFSAHSLKLRPKAGPLESFSLNAAQQHLHEVIEAQKAKTGRVRVVVLKARQLGVSTYTAARLYHRTINNPGLRTIIIGHERRASSNLFDLVRRFHENMPEDQRPHTGTSNAQELIFDKIDSGYLVSVATHEGAGRSATAQCLHASECAFWENLPLQMAALLQTVPDMNGTEIIIESTANGYNDFHSLWRKAESGESEFLPVFLPWSLDAGYARELPEGFVMDSEESKLADLHKLTPQQMCWRRNKISQLGSAEYFAQEYPLTASEAFISSTFDSFIPANLVIKARQEEVEAFGPLIIGVDPAGMGADRTSIAWRKGRVITKMESRRGIDTMEVVGWVQRIIREDKPAKVNIDVGGLGVGVYDRLIELGHSRSLVNSVNFGSKPNEIPPLDERGQPAGGPANRRSELWSNMKKVLEEGRFSLPDSDSLQADLVSCGYKYNSEGRLVLESKQDMRRRGVPSPDEGDAVALCFSEPDGSGFVRNKNFNQDLRSRYGGAYI